MIEITFKRKKKLKRSATLSMHIDGVLLEDFKNKCAIELGIVYTDVIRNFIDDTVSGKIKIKIEE